MTLLITLMTSIAFTLKGDTSYLNNDESHVELIQLNVMNV